MIKGLILKASLGAAFVLLWAFLSGSGRADGDIGGLLAALMTGWLLYVPFLLLSVHASCDAPFSGGPSHPLSSVFRLILGASFAAIAFILAGRWVLGAAAWSGVADVDSPAWRAPFVLVVVFFSGSLVGVAALERAVFRQRTAGVLTLLLAYAVLLAPFCLDGFIEAHQDAVFTDRWLGRAATLSPPVLLAQETFGADIFRREAIYQRFLIGEQMLAPRDLKQSLYCFGLAGLSGAILAAFLGRFLTRKSND